MRWLQQLETREVIMALHTQKRRKREEQRAEETELTGNICSMCLPPSGREFAPHAGWSALASLLFLLRFGCTGGEARGRSAVVGEREWNLQLCSSMRKNYFSGNTTHSRKRKCYPPFTSKTAGMCETARQSSVGGTGGKLLSSAWICLLAR